MRDHDAFARAFAEFWAAPQVEGLPALLADDVRLVQPLTKPTVGLAAAKARTSSSNFV